MATGVITDGYYWLQPASGGAAYRLLCDFGRNGGGWTQVMRGIGGNSMAAYTTSSGDVNVPADRDMSAVAASTTWKLSDDAVNLFQTSDASGAGDQAATYWVEGAGSCAGANNQFYHDCQYAHTQGTVGGSGCGKPSTSATMSSKQCAGASTVAAHMGVGCPSGACTHSNTNGDRGWYFSTCSNGATVGCDMSFWVR